MAEQAITQVNKQFEKTVLGPARSYAALVTEHAEALAGIQFDAAKAYTDLALKQVRAAADIRDAEGVKSYVAGQSDMARQVSDRVKKDVEKLASANQSFVRKTQKLTEDSVATGRKAAEESVATVRKAAEASGEAVQQTAEESAQTSRKAAAGAK